MNKSKNNKKITNVNINEEPITNILNNKIDKQIDKQNDNYLYYIIYIQKYYKGYNIRKYILIPCSCYQTKQWRQNRKWYDNGKHNECEKYQFNLIEKIMKIKNIKTNDRINLETYDIIEKIYPMKDINGFEWTENFDGKITNNDNIYYFNLKFICDKGGSQTRTMREVYHFIKLQIFFLIKNKTSNIFFINILDGDTNYNNMDKYNYLINKDLYKDVKKYIFIGCLYNFQKDIRFNSMVK